MSSCTKKAVEKKRKPGSMFCTELKENSGAPVRRLAMGQPSPKKSPLEVWLLWKLNQPPGSKWFESLSCCQRASPPNLSECRPLIQVTKSATATALSPSWLSKLVDPPPW